MEPFVPDFFYLALMALKFFLEHLSIVRPLSLWYCVALTCALRNLPQRDLWVPSAFLSVKDNTTRTVRKPLCAHISPCLGWGLEWYPDLVSSSAAS